MQSALRDAAKPKSQVPVWRQGLAWSALSVDYQRILKTLADRARFHQGPLTCQEMAAMFGMDVVPTRVEALRSKAKRLVARGWLAEQQPGRFTLAAGVTGQATGHEPDHRPVDHRLRAGGAPLEVAHQAATSHQVGEEALDDPPLGQHHEPFLVVAALDDRQDQGERGQAVHRIASSMARWQYASGRPPRPRIQLGTGSSGRTRAHSVSVIVMSVGYRRSRIGVSAAFPNR